MSAIEKETVNIRRMLRRDIDAVLALDRKIGGGRGLISYKDMATADIGGPLDLSFVAETDGKIIGILLTRLAYLMVPFAEVCIIQGIAVDPDYQRHGIGSKLVDRLLTHCHAEGINRIRALVAESNDDLRRFIQRHGFHRSAIINYDKTFET